MVMEVLGIPTGGGESRSLHGSTCVCTHMHTHVQIQVNKGKSRQDRPVVPMSLCWL